MGVYNANTLSEMKYCLKYVCIRMFAVMTKGVKKKKMKQVLQRYVCVCARGN